MPPAPLRYLGRQPQRDRANLCKPRLVPGNGSEARRWESRMQCAAEQPPIVRRQLALEVEPCLVKSKEIGPGNDRRVVKIQHRDGRRDLAPDHLLTKATEERKMSVQV